MAAKDQVGRYGEDVAARHLSEAGCEVLARNWRCELGELDIVAVDGAEDSGEYVRCRCESGTSFKAAPTSADGPLTDVDCEVVHALEGQFKLVLGKAFCMQEPVTWSDELGNFVILQAARR